MLKGLITDKLNELKSDPSSPVYRIVAGVILSIIYSSYPVFIFLIYMWNNGFYSYDVIGEGFSLSLFFYADFLLIVIIALVFLGSVFTTAISLKKNLQDKGRKEAWEKALHENSWFIVVNVFLTISFVIHAFGAEEKTIFVFILITTLLVITLLTALIITRAQTYFKLVVLVTGAIYVVPILFPKEASILLADGLKFFGAGNRVIELYSTDQSAPLEMSGELVFLSPNNVYIKEEDTENLMIIPRRDALNIKYLDSVTKQNDESQTKSD